MNQADRNAGMENKARDAAIAEFERRRAGKDTTRVSGAERSGKDTARGSEPERIGKDTGRGSEPERSGSTRSRQRDLPTTPQLEAELKHVLYARSFRRTLWNTVYTLVTVAAIAVLVAVLLLPVLRIYGTSMSPTLTEGSIVVSLKGSRFETGDVIAFYYNNKILVKRVVAFAGDWVDIDEDGYVYVNNVKIDEPYLNPEERAFGECNITLPYQVPESRVFVLGDNRSTSVDSRNTAVGCVAEEQIVGRIAFCVWPLNSFGSINN